jgi:hypothetical protein
VERDKCCQSLVVSTVCVCVCVCMVCARVIMNLVLWKRRRHVPPKKLAGHARAYIHVSFRRSDCRFF